MNKPVANFLLLNMVQKDIELLVVLLRASLGEIPSMKPKVIELKKVYELSREQEVTAMAMDGLQRLVAIFPNVLQTDVPTKAVKMQWVGSVVQQERKYETNLLSAKELATLYDRNQLLTYVLKGFTVSQLYPIPSHRFSCDFDCFLTSQTGSFDAFKQGNEIISSKGCKVDADYYKHSAFIYKGLTVENHRYCCSVKRGKRTMELERYLESLLHGYTPQYLADTKLATPPQMFQALFMIEHANGHFLYSKMNLKHVCDWAMMRKAFKETLDWVEFDKQCACFGLKNFVECMNHLADYVLGERSYNDLSPIDKRVLEDTFKEVHYSQNLMKQRVEKAIGVLRSSWKFKHFCGDSMLKELTHSLWAYLRNKESELD